jgi:hypothetical protein
VKTLSAYRSDALNFRQWSFALLCAVIFVLYCAYVVRTMRSDADTIAVHIQGLFAIPALIFGFLNIAFNLPFSDAVFLTLFALLGLGFGRFTTMIWSRKPLRALLIITLLLNSGIMVGLIIRAYSRFSYF